MTSARVRLVTQLIAPLVLVLVFGGCSTPEATRDWDAFVEQRSGELSNFDEDWFNKMADDVCAMTPAEAASAENLGIFSESDAYLLASTACGEDFARQMP